MGIEEAAVDLYHEVERELCRIPEVTAARIVTGPAGRPTEVHILASPEKHAKQVVRDVQSVAMASFGIDFDRRIISVVQLDAGAPGSVPAAQPDAAPATEDEPWAGRIVVEGVIAQRHGTHGVAQVSLRRGDASAVGTAEGLMGSSSALRLVATATLGALRELEPAAAHADIEVASMVRLGDRPVALVSLVFVAPPTEEIVTGSAPVRATGDADAIVRAVLDATNRRLGRLGEP